jgi:hypothetical protein
MHSNFYVLPKRGKEVHQTLDREYAGTIAHQGGHVGLLDAEDLSSLRLGKAARLDEAVNLQGQPRFQEFPLGIGKAEVGEYIPATHFRFDGPFAFGAHLNSTSLHEDVQPRRAGAG